MASSDVVSLPALHQACRDGDSAALSVLISTSIADRLQLFHRICECDSYLGWTPAHWAAYHGKFECLRRLLSCGLNVDIGECRYKRTPAHVAAFAGHPHMLLWLLQAGAEPNKQDDNGDTVVHHAARSGSNDCLTILHSHNAYMCLTNKEGQTPLEVASMLGFEHSVQYLSQFHSQHFYSGAQNLKRGLDEDEINREVKRACNASSRKVQLNGNDCNHTLGLLNVFPPKDKPAMQVESQMNEDLDDDDDDDMEVLCGDPRPMSAAQAKLDKPTTKLSIPQRCMGSHFM